MHDTLDTPPAARYMFMLGVRRVSYLVARI